MIKKIKNKYNKWLFKKYGFNRGSLFNKIPKILLMPHLFSPSLYSYYECQEMVKGLKEGLEKDINEKI